MRMTIFIASQGIHQILPPGDLLSEVQVGRPLCGI